MTLPPGLWWRGPLAAVLVLALLLAAGEALVNAALPAVRWTIGLLADEFEVLVLALDRQGADRVVRLQVTLAHTVVLGGRALVPDPRGVAEASTLALQCLHGPALALWLALAWPGALARRLGVVAVLAVLLLLADLPAVLAGSVWQILVDGLAPGDTTPLLSWKALWVGGGRLALGLAAGAAAIVLGAPRPALSPRPTAAAPLRDQSRSPQPVARRR